MALPTVDSLKNFIYAFQGQPFVSVPAKTFTLLNMEYAWQAQPFVGNYTAVGGWAHIAKVKGVAAANITKIGGVAVASIAKVGGVAV